MKALGSQHPRWNVVLSPLFVLAIPIDMPRNLRVVLLCISPPTSGAGDTDSLCGICLPICVSISVEMELLDAGPLSGMGLARTFSQYVDYFFILQKGFLQSGRLEG